MKMSDAFIMMLAMIVTLSVYTTLFADDQDIDEDGFSVDQWDCDDYDSSVHPEAFEVCRDGIDQNCDGDGYTAAQGDRDDADPGVYPGAPEICGDTIDQNCDGVDQLCPEDLDTDGDQYTPDAGDCNDQSFTGIV
jgi:hypothetical protein